MKTTPEQVRKELKNHHLPFQIEKTSNCWYVYGEECTLWYSQSLNTYKVSGLSAAKWVEMIVDMAIENRPRVLNGLQTITAVAEQDQSGLRKVRSDLGSKRGPYKKKSEKE